MSRPLPRLVSDRLTDGAAGITSVCTAHPLAIEAALAHGLRTGRRVLIEATCNQVNQDGGYTGMTPAGFRRFVEGIARRVGFDPARVIPGGGHLGPNPWKGLPPDQAMARATTMIEAYAAAGFAKLHLDTSMGCAGEPAALADEVTAERAAALAKAAEAACAEGPGPVYVIGTEVPVPGGAQHALDDLEVTRPEAALRTVEVHRRAFADVGLDEAFARRRGRRATGCRVRQRRCDRVSPRGSSQARKLAATLPGLPGLVFEAHSTDYQPAAALAALVRDGFAILKVGPWLTFALREALYGLDAIAQVLAPMPDDDGIPAVMELGLPSSMEALMAREPDNWQRYYEGDADQQRFQRHFSFSDRIRYYWPHPEARRAVDQLFARLGDRVIPNPLVSQYLGGLYPGVEDGSLVARPRRLALAAVEQVLERYDRACQ